MHKLWETLRRVRETAHLMVGLPDYDRYVAHIQSHHPDATVMTRAQFVDERTTKRFGGGNGMSRCC